MKARLARTVLVTGASSGIGAAIAQRLTQEGDRVILAARRKERCEEICQELARAGVKGSAVAIEMDVTRAGSVAAAVAGLPKEFAQIDVVIHNAGLARGLDLIQDGKPEDWNEMIDTNLKGVLNVTHAVLPLLQRSKDAHILSIGSTAGKLAYPRGNVYSSTKAGLDMLMQSLRIDLLPLGIKVTTVHPGAVETEFSEVRFRGDRTRAKAVYQGFQPLVASDVADVVAYCLSLPAHVCINDLVMTPRAQANSVTFHKVT